MSSTFSKFLSSSEGRKKNEDRSSFKRSTSQKEISNDEISESSPKKGKHKRRISLNVTKGIIDDIIPGSMKTSTDFLTPSFSPKRSRENDSHKAPEKSLRSSESDIESVKYGDGVHYAIPVNRSLSNTESSSSRKKNGSHKRQLSEAGNPPDTGKRVQMSPRDCNPNRRFSRSTSGYRKTSQELIKNYNGKTSRLEKSVSSNTLPKFNLDPKKPVKSAFKRFKPGSKVENRLSFSSDFSALSTRQPVLSTSLILMLEVMGIHPDDRSDILAFIDEKVPDEAQSCVTSLFSQNKIKLLERLVGATTTAMDYQKRHISAQRIQSCYRTFIIRKKLKNANLTRIIKYNNVAHRLLNLEQEYIHSLSVVVKDYLDPLIEQVESGKDIVKREDISYLFSNIKNILHLHEQHFGLLEWKVLTRWPFVEGIGQAIIQLGKGFEEYSTYVSNMKTSRSTLDRLKDDKNHKFNSWLRDNKLDLESMQRSLDLPLSHIAQLQLHMEEIAPLCLSGSLEEVKCNHAFSMLRETSNFVMHHFLLSEENLKVTNTIRRLSGTIDSLKIEQRKGLRFLEESQFIVKKKKYTFLLFSQFLIIGKAKGNTIKVKSHADLEVVFLEKKGDSSTSFVIKTPYSVYDITCTANEKLDWMKHLEEWIPSRKRSPTFNVPIQVILDREKRTVPSLVTQCIEYFDSDPSILKTEGIFRISGDRRRIHELKDKFDNYPEDERDLSGSKVHNVAGMFKLWFRELPEPLVPSSLYDSIIQKENNTTSCTKEDLINFYQNTLSHVNDNALPTFKYLVQFLNRVCNYSKDNKMSMSNLAIVFGPTIIRPAEETMETTLNSPLVNQAVQRLIEDWEQIF